LQGKAAREAAFLECMMEHLLGHPHAIAALLLQLVGNVSSFEQLVSIHTQLEQNRHIHSRFRHDNAVGDFQTILGGLPTLLR